MNSDNEFDDLDLDRLPGIFDNNLKNNNVQNLEEEKMPFFHELLERPIQDNHINNFENENNNSNKINQKHEEIFTFKNVNSNNREKKMNRDNYKTDLNGPINNNKKKRIEDGKIDKLKVDVITFEDLMKKTKNQNINKSKDKKEKKKMVKIDFSGKLYQNKKKYEPEKGNEETKKELTLKNKTDKLIKDLSHNKSDIAIKTKKIIKYNNNFASKNKNHINEKEENLYNYFKLDNSAKKKSNIILNYKNKNIILNFENTNDERNNKSYVADNNSRDISLMMNKSSRTVKSKDTKRKKMNIINDFEDKYKLAFQKEDSKKMPKRHSNIKDELIHFDKSKFEKYDTEQIRYDLIKDYSFIHAEKDNDFLERMQFDFLKRKNKEKKINEFVEKNKNKYKLNEMERKKTFNRLIEDAKRRIVTKQEILENEKYLTDYRELLDNSKKYNQDEWDKIYKKRFQEYEEIKKKKIDIQRQNEKIKKMLKEEEEINMCQMKKISSYKIKQNSERLFNDARRRAFLRNNKNLIKDKSNKNFNFYKNNNCLTNFNDEEDASKYMKNFKGVEYSFYKYKKDIMKQNKNNYFERPSNNFENSNKSFDKRNLKKNDKISVTEFNNLRFDTNDNNLYNYQKKKNKKRSFNFNDNVIQPYFNFKKTKKQNLIPNNNYIPSPTMPCEYNYNNYNIYNINNLNNNINSNLNNNPINHFNDDNDYLNAITNQLIQSAALNKIGNINNKFQNDKYKAIMNNMNNQESEGNQLIEQFLSSQLEN